MTDSYYNDPNFLKKDNSNDIQSKTPLTDAAAYHVTKEEGPTGDITEEVVPAKLTRSIENPCLDYNQLKINTKEAESLIGTRWQRKEQNEQYQYNGYTVLMVTNLLHEHPSHPPQVVYKGDNQKIWSLGLAQWPGSLEPETEENFINSLILKKTKTHWDHWSGQDDQTIKEFVELLISEKVSLKNVDLRGADLQYISFKDVNLRGANFRGANLQGCDFQGCNLQYVNFRDANLQYISTQNANLRGANLKNADLRNSDLKNTNFQRANLWGAKLQGCNFQNSNFQRAILWGANIRNSKLQNVNFRNTNLKNVIGLSTVIS